jgi:hypothetical protein
MTLTLPSGTTSPLAMVTSSRRANSVQAMNSASVTMTMRASGRQLGSG